MSQRRAQADWLEALLGNLARVDAGTLAYIQSRGVQVGFRRQTRSTGAIWLPGRRIYLNPVYYSLKTDPGDAQLLGVLVHEVRHLQQGFFTALSVFGELEAWQLGFRVIQQLTGQPHPAVIAEIMALPAGWERDVLWRARDLMQAYAGKGYRVDLLPLYPLPQEIRYRLKMQLSAGTRI